MKTIAASRMSIWLLALAATALLLVFAGSAAAGRISGHGVRHAVAKKGADDRIGHVRRGGEVRRHARRGLDDAIGHARRGADDPVGDDRGADSGAVPGGGADDPVGDDRGSDSGGTGADDRGGDRGGESGGHH